MRVREMRYQKDERKRFFDYEPELEVIVIIDD